MKTEYKHARFYKKTLARIFEINSILDEYAEQGYNMTIRQLYYQMVSRKVISFDNREYEKLVELIGKARDAGLIDWEQIVDRSRNPYQVSLSESVEDALKKAAGNYHIDLWENMPTRPVIWFEKAGLTQIIGRAASRYNLEYMSTRGESSLTWLHEVSQQDNILILYLGDHDGHGVQISDGMERKIDLYSDGAAQFRRVGISLSQGREIEAPQIPLKDVTNLSFDYRERFECSYGYEIDAFSPDQLYSLITEEIKAVIGIDKKIFNDNLRRQHKERKEIADAVS